MTAWAHLPNAALIDEVLASVKTSPEKWDAARNAAPNAAWDTAQNAAREATRNAAWVAARNAAWVAARDTAWDAARDTVWGPIWDAGNAAAWGVIATLVTYDDASQFMRLPAEHLQRLYRIDPHPMFLLLQPAAIVFAAQKEDQHASAKSNEHALPSIVAGLPQDHERVAREQVLCPG